MTGEFIEAGRWLGDDPTLRPDELEQKGCWDYHPRVRSMAAHKKLLDEALAVLTQPAAKK